MKDTQGHVSPRQATAQLIARMAQDSEQTPLRAPLQNGLMASTFMALTAAAVTVLLMAQPRHDLWNVWTSWNFQFKAIAVLLLIAGCVRMFKAAAHPGSAIKPACSLMPGCVFLAAGAVFDGPDQPLFGAHGYSVVTCLGTILAASTAPMAILLYALRRGVPTDLRTSGAIAGMLAGTLAALAYTIACLNDSAGFVALWYSCAIAILGAIGALIGPKVLKW